MKTIKYQYLSRGVKISAVQLSFILLWLLLSFSISLLPGRTIILLGVLLIGLPLTALVVSNRTRNIAVVLMLAFLPLTGILKAATGSRFAPFTFDIGLFLACVIHFFASASRDKLRLGTRDVLLFFLWVLAFFEIFNSNVPNLQAGIEGFHKFIYISIAFYIGRHMFRLKDFRLLGKGLLLVSTAVTLYGIKQFFIMWPIDYRMIELAQSSSITFLMGGWIRPFATMSGPFHLGLFLTVTSLLFLSSLDRQNTRLSHRPLLVALLVLQILLLLMTRTKGNWAGFIIGVVTLLFLQSRNPFRVIVKVSGFTFLVIAVVLLATQIAPKGALAILDDAIFAGMHPLQAPTLLYRLELWNETIIPAIQTRPLFGYGTSSAGEGLQALYANARSLHFISHNLYIKIWLEMGFVGLIIFLLLVGSSLRNGTHQLFKSTTGETRLFLQWSIAVVIAFLMSGLVIPTLDAYPVNYYFWLLLGLLSRTATLEKYGESRCHPIS